MGQQKECLCHTSDNTNYISCFVVSNYSLKCVSLTSLCAALQDTAVKRCVLVSLQLCWYKCYSGKSVNSAVPTT